MNHTVKELKTLCKKNKIKGYSKLNKAELVKIYKKNKISKGGNDIDKTEIFNIVKSKTPKRKDLIQIIYNMKIKIQNTRAQSIEDLRTIILKKLNSCHEFDEDKSNCKKTNIRKGLRKYKCEFVVHSKKPSQCIKKGNVLKYKGYKISE